MQTGKFLQWFDASYHAPDSRGRVRGDPGFCQRGVGLVEVLIAVLVLSVGVLGAASLQLSAIRYSASAGNATQASILAHDMLDRMRANPSSLASYAVATVAGACSPSTGIQDIAKQDLADFSQAITCQLPGADGSIVIAGGRATVSISWSEKRISSNTGDTVFVVSSVVR